MTTTIDRKEAAGAIIIVASGACLAGYAWLHYPMGSPNEMGPGFFPVALGIIQIGIGLMLAVPALARSGAFPAVEWRPLVAVMLSGAFFALSIDRLGLVPAVVGLVLIIRCADGEYAAPWIILLAAVMALVAVLIFRLGLNMPFAIVGGLG